MRSQLAIFCPTLQHGYHGTYGTDYFFSSLWLRQIQLELRYRLDDHLRVKTKTDESTPGCRKKNSLLLNTNILERILSQKKKAGSQLKNSVKER